MMKYTHHSITNIHPHPHIRYSYTHKREVRVFFFFSFPFIEEERKKFQYSNSFNCSLFSLKLKQIFRINIIFEEKKRNHYRLQLLKNK